MRDRARDIRGPVIERLAASDAERLFWRYRDEDGGVWMFECVRDEDAWWCVRQINPTGSGVAAYDCEHLEDDDGFLADQPIPDDAPGERIAADDFEATWRVAIAARRDA